MNTKRLLLITVFMATVGSLSAITMNESEQNSHDQLVYDITESNRCPKVGDRVVFGGKGYTFKEFNSYTNNISYKLTRECKIKNVHWATEIVSYGGSPKDTKYGYFRKSYDYNKTIKRTAGGFLLVGGLALIGGVAWLMKSMMPVKQQG